MPRVRAREHHARDVRARRDQHQAERHEDRRQDRDEFERQRRHRALRFQFDADRFGLTRFQRGVSLRHGAPHERRQRALRPLDADIPAQPHDHAHFRRLRRTHRTHRARRRTRRRRACGSHQLLTHDRAVHRERHPQIARRVVESAELRPHHADDDEGLIVERNLASEHRRIAIEQPFPSLVAQHGDGGAARRARIELRDAAAQAHPVGDAERVEVVAGDEGRRERQAARIRDDGASAFGDHLVEQILPCAQLFVVAPPEARAARVGRAPRERLQAVGIVHGERPQHVGVEDGEEDGDQAEGDRERHDGRGEKRRAAHQPAPRVARVLRELFQPEPRPRDARLVKPLARHQHASERPPRRIARVVRTHAVGDQALGLDLEVRLDLPLEVVVAPPFGRHTTQV